jgi:predicted nucleic acid-binding protein
VETGIIIDACIFIEYFRAKNKDSSALENLLKKYKKCFVSAVAKYEVLCGAADEDVAFWETIFSNMEILPFDDLTINKARQIYIYRQLNRKKRLIDAIDILIAATAIVYDLPLSTLNRKHFERIDELQLL